MPSDAHLRALIVLQYFVKQNIAVYVKSNFLAKISFLLGYNAPNSSSGILSFLKGGDLVEEERKNGYSQIKINFHAAKEFIEKQSVALEFTKDKKVIGEKK